MWSTVLVLALGQAIDQPSGDGVGDTSDDSHFAALLLTLQDDPQPGEPLSKLAQPSDDDKPKVTKKKKKKKKKDWKVGYKDGLFVKSP